MYTNDLQGWISASIVKRYYMSNHDKLVLSEYNASKPNIESHFIRMTKGDNLILVNIELSSVDLSFIEDTCKGRYFKFVYINNLTIDNRATCELVWQHYYHYEAMPKCINLLGEYYSDRYKKKSLVLSNVIVAIKYAMEAMITSPFTVPSDIYDYRYDTNKQVEIGKGIINYLKNKGYV